MSLAAMMLCTGAAAQAVSRDGTAVVESENTSFSDCVETIRSVYTERYPEQIELVNNVIDDIISDETFLACYEYEGETAFRILEDTLMDALTPTIEPYSYDGINSYSAYTVPTLTQKNNYYCGPAVVQMALIGSGIWKNNDYNKAQDRQDEIAKAVGTTASNGTAVYQITNYLQKQLNESSGITYKNKIFTCYTYDKMASLFDTSLRSNKIPILNIPDTSYLGYYNGKRYSTTSGHYIIIKNVNMSTRKFTVVDPFRLSYVDDATNKRLNDVHEISFDDLFELADKKNFWTSVYTYTDNDKTSYVF